MVDGGSVFGQIPRAEWEQCVKPDRKNRIRLALNSLLIRTPSMNILVDTGAGSKRADKFKELYGLNGNKLVKGLKSLGLTARDIQAVVLSNLHFAHGGGCTKLDRTGTAVPTFPKAKYLVQKACWEEANAPNERYKDSFYSDDFLPLEERGLLELMDGDAEVIPGVSVKVTNGPAHGHQIILVERGSEKVAYVSDLIPTPYHVSLPYIAASDENPNETLAQKRRLLQMAAEGGWLLVFGHGNEHRAGYVQQRNGKPKLVPIER